MNPEIDRLIKIAIADGEISEKERGVILRKAESLGLDKDEVEMILEGELALMKTEHQKVNQIQPKSNKEGELKKCPSCGAPVKSFTSKCPECGHEFRNINAEHSINELFKTLQAIEKNERNKPRAKSFASMLGDIDIEREIAIGHQLSNAIESFPVPNSKESILEFLSMAIPQTKIKIQKLFGMTVNTDKGKQSIKNAWISKCEQIIIKARFAFKDDGQLLQEIEMYAKQLKLNK